MKVYKLSIDEYDDLDYELIAIHSSLEDFRLAYFINQNLSVNLKKSKGNVILNDKNGETHFSRFFFEDIKKDISWNLIQNENETQTANRETVGDLFAETKNIFAAKNHLIPEHKNVDYFLKIENSEDSTAILKIVNKLKKITKITAVYPLNTEKIKSKNNLIF
jgi:hypothetical protein